MKRPHAFNTSGQAFARPARRTQGTCGVAFNRAIGTKDGAPQMWDPRLSAKIFLIILSKSDAEKLQPALRRSVGGWSVPSVAARNNSRAQIRPGCSGSNAQPLAL